MSENRIHGASTEDPSKPVSGAMETAIQAARDGAADARAAVDRAIPAISEFVSRFVYTTSYSLSYGFVFPAMLLVRAVPKDNAIVQGMVDGARPPGTWWTTGRASARLFRRRNRPRRRYNRRHPPAGGRARTIALNGSVEWRRSRSDDVTRRSDPGGRSEVRFRCRSRDPRRSSSRRASQPVLRPGPTYPEVKEKLGPLLAGAGAALGDAYTEVARRVAEKVESVQDSVAEKRQQAPSAGGNVHAH